MSQLHGTCGSTVVRKPPTAGPPCQLQQRVQRLLQAHIAHLRYDAGAGPPGRLPHGRDIKKRSDARGTQRGL